MHGRKHPIFKIILIDLHFGIADFDLLRPFGRLWGVQTQNKQLNLIQ
jgi:hypothetical protein